MVDSGSVMSFFGIRPMTDLDLLFAQQVQRDILGWRNGTLVEHHAFPSNVLRGEHSWGAYHFTGSCKDELDLFSDPANYGYCHGIKYACRWCSWSGTSGDEVQ